MAGSTSPNSPAKAGSKTIKTPAKAGLIDWTSGDAVAFQMIDGATLDQVPKGAQVLVVAETKAAAEALSKTSLFRRIRRRGYRRKASAVETAAPAAGATQYKAQYRQAMGRLMKEDFAPGPRARAILRGVENARKDLKDAGGAFDVEDVRKLLHGVSRQAIDKRVKDGALLTVPGPSGKRGFPALQFQPDGAVVPGLKEVQAALGYASPWSVLNFLVNPHDLLDGRAPIDLLRRGEVALVERAASLSGVHAE